MEKYLVFLIAWFGNKFIKHIKIPQGLQDCRVSKQSHLPWPCSCRIRKDCLLFSPRNTTQGIYVASEILIALEPQTKNPCSPNRAVVSGNFAIPCVMPLSWSAWTEGLPCGALACQGQQSSARAWQATEAHRPVEHEQPVSCRLQWTNLMLIVFKILLRAAEQGDSIFICSVFFWDVTIAFCNPVVCF